MASPCVYSNGLGEWNLHFAVNFNPIFEVMINQSFSCLVYSFAYSALKMVIVIRIKNPCSFYWLSYDGVCHCFYHHGRIRDSWKYKVIPVNGQWFIIILSRRLNVNASETKQMKAKQNKKNIAYSSINHKKKSQWYDTITNAILIKMVKFTTLNEHQKKNKQNVCSFFVVNFMNFLSRFVHGKFVIDFTERKKWKITHSILIWHRNCPTCSMNNEHDIRTKDENERYTTQQKHTYAPK